jgi:hypothetical protein
MALCIKPGVRFDKFSPQILLGLYIVHKVYEEHNQICTVTSGTDGKHGPRSRHPSGNAVDIRSKSIAPSSEKVRMLEICRHRLGSNYDMILELDGKPNEHFHLEYDPK